MNISKKFGAGKGEHTGESASQELDVNLLVLGDGLQVVVEGGVEAGGGELLLGVVGQTLAVELVLKVLQGEGIVEDYLFTVSQGKLRNREEGNALSASVMGAACLLTGLAVVKPAAATRATTD